MHAPDEGVEELLPRNYPILDAAQMDAVVAAVRTDGLKKNVGTVGNGKFLVKVFPCSGAVSNDMLGTEFCLKEGLVEVLKVRGRVERHLEPYSVLDGGIFSFSAAARQGRQKRCEEKGKCCGFQFHNENCVIKISFFLYLYLMTLQEAILARHSVRAYKEQALPDGLAEALNAKVGELNSAGKLHIQLIQDEPKAFLGPLAKYGRFRGVGNYFVVAGRKAEDLEERAGYYGEMLVLYAQTLGLRTCWVGLSYSKIPGTYVLAEDERIVCYIAVGFGENDGVQHRSKQVAEVSNAGAETPKWFLDGVNAALLAPTALNQQKFRFDYLGGESGAKAKVAASRSFSVAGYTKTDLGIAKLHFEIGAGKENFDWAE